MCWYIIRHDRPQTHRESIVERLSSSPDGRQRGISSSPPRRCADSSGAGPRRFHLRGVETQDHAVVSETPRSSPPISLRNPQNAPPTYNCSPHPRYHRPRTPAPFSPAPATKPRHSSSSLFSSSFPGEATGEDSPPSSSDSSPWNTSWKEDAGAVCGPASSFHDVS